MTICRDLMDLVEPKDLVDPSACPVYKGTMETEEQLDLLEDL